MWIKGTGKLVYDPVRPDFRKSHKTRTLIVELPRTGLDLYYQWFLRKQFGDWLHLQRPMYGLHITVVKGDEHVPDMSSWKAYQGEIIDFEYSPELQVKWRFWSLPVRSKALQSIRRELCLKADYPFHITIGRQYDWQPINYVPRSLTK